MKCVFNKKLFENKTLPKLTNLKLVKVVLSMLIAKVLLNLTSSNN